MKSEKLLDGRWFWNAEGVGHYFLKYHSWSLCGQEHRMYTTKKVLRKRCKACAIK